MSASLLSGNASLGLAAPVKSAGAKAPAKESSGESAFQTAVGSAGEGQRRMADGQPDADAGDPAPRTEETTEPTSRPPSTDDRAPRLHKWILGMDGGPAAGDLLLSGGALKPEEGAPAAPDDAIETGSEETHPRRPAPRPETETQGPETDKAPADASLPPADDTDGIQAVSDDGAPSDGGSLGIAPDPVEPAEEAHRPAEAPKPTPVDGGPTPQVQVAENNPAGGDDPVIDRHAGGNAAEHTTAKPLPDTTDQPVRPEPAAMQASPPPTPGGEQVSAGNANAAPEPRNPQAVGTGHVPLPVAAVVGQSVASAARQPVVGAKAAPAQNGDRAVERLGADPPDAAVDDTGRQERLRMDDSGRNLQARDPAGDQRPDRRPASADQPGPPAVARDPGGGQSAPPTIQSPTVTVVEARQYVAPQQTNSEAIVRAVSGNELWSAALRNEAPVQSGTPLQTLKIRLNPAELGMVDATLRLSGDRLVVELNVETAEAYRQLSDSRQNVLNALRGQGYGVEQISVQLTAPDRGGQSGTSTGQQQGGFEGQLTQDNSRQSGEGGRFGQENGNGDNRGSGNAQGGEAPAGEAPSLPPGVAADGSVYL